MNYTLEKTEGPIQTALATLGRQDTERRQTKHKTKRRKRYLGEWNVRECRMNNTESHWTQGTDIRQTKHTNKHHRKLKKIK